MTTKLWAIGLVALSTLLIAFGQVFYKIAANKLSWNIFILLLDYNFYIGLFLYGISCILLLIALKNGELSVLYPVIGLGYVWVTLLSSYFFNDIINIQKWTGVIIIIIGITFIGIGSSK